MTDLEFREHVIGSLAELKADMKTLIGNGQPGRVGKLEAAVAKLENWQSKQTGIVIGVSSVIATACGILLHVFHLL